ncbi:Appr-1-p processing enzyme family domain-containing protein, putative [Eimeria praecox]|uniref:Appr-1-p processing enzyme family domain-containing protein, putative n=1 Tax=Eimeria praecox TaxID=51316 RepID=U6G3U6_9EIME|nr:Appr-1-p processing enzyme family domain-containing protein, putative [Eimeria praecox]
MSLGELIQDAAAWVTEEIRKSIDDLNDEEATEYYAPSDSASYQHERISPKPVIKTVPLEALLSWQEDKLDLEEEEEEKNRAISPGIDACYLLPRELGNLSGEIDVAERRIRFIQRGASGVSSSSSSSAAAAAVAAAAAAGGGGESEGTAAAPPLPVFGGLLARQEESESDDEDSDEEEEILQSNDVSFRIAKTETETERRLEALNIKHSGAAATAAVAAAAAVAAVAAATAAAAAVVMLC